MAVESPHVHADVIEVSEYPDLVEREHVRAVPPVIINGARGSRERLGRTSQR